MNSSGLSVVKIVGALFAVFFGVVGLISAGTNFSTIANLAQGKEPPGTIRVSSEWLSSASKTSIQLSRGKSPSQGTVYTGEFNHQTTSVIITDGPFSAPDGLYCGIRAPGFDEQIRAKTGSNAIAYQGTKSLWMHYAVLLLASVLVVLLAVGVLVCCLKGGS